MRETPATTWGETDRATWERAADGALLGIGYKRFRGNMRERLEVMFPIRDRCGSTNNERCLMFLFMACIEDDEDAALEDARPQITECPGCGSSWSDGRAYCDHDHCERAEAVRRAHAERTQIEERVSEVAA